MDETDVTDLPKGEAYLWLALQAIKFASNADELRKWWREENDSRDDYGLTEEQSETIIAACKVRLEELGDQPVDRAQQDRKKRRARRRAAI